MTAIVVRKQEGPWYLRSDFQTWTANRNKAHRWIPGAALNQALEATKGCCETFPDPVPNPQSWDRWRDQFKALVKRQNAHTAYVVRDFRRLLTID